MGLKTKKILGIDVTISPEVEILEEIRKYLKKIKNQKSKIKSEEIKPLVIFTPNPEIVNFAQKDDNFRKLVNTAQINLPDGAGVVWAMRKIHGLKIDKIPGSDFMLDLAKLSEEESLTVGLIGGKGGVAVSTLECLRQNHPKLSGWAMDGPEIEIKNEKLKIKNYQGDKFIKEMVIKIQSEKTDILFVGMGFPKQEYLIENFKFPLQGKQISNFKLKKPIVIMSVGGAFDYISGRVPRAPKWVRSMGFEWFYRLFREPWRLPRMIKGRRFFLRVAFSSFFPIQYS